MPSFSNVFLEPGVFSQFNGQGQQPVVPGSTRVVALLGDGRQTKIVRGEQVTKGALDGSDSLAHVATSLGSTITDEDFATYTLGVDYVLTSGDVAWSPASVASITGTTTQTFASLVGKTLILAVDGGSNQTYTFVSGDFAVPAAATAAEVATAITTNFTGVTSTAVLGSVRISTASTNNGSLLIGNGTSNSILGFTGGSFVATPKEPAVGKIYFVDYEYAKVSADYIPRFFASMTDVVLEHGDVSTSNTLSLGAEVAFQNGASIVCTIQIDPADGATLTQFQKAFDKLLPVKGLNILVPLTPDSNLYAYAKSHVNTASSLANRNERMVFLGLTGTPSVSSVMSQAAALADKRVVLVYPPSATRFVGTNTTESTLDGSFLAAALAGIRANPDLSISQPLTRKEVVGFTDIPDILTRVEKNQLSNSGVCVIEDIDNLNIFRVRFGTTTDPSTISNREISVVEIVDYVATSLRTLLENIYVGQRILADTPSQVSATTAKILTGLTANPNPIIVSFQNVTCAINGTDPTQLDVSFSISPVNPLNYIFISFSLSSTN